MCFNSPFFVFWFLKSLFSSSTLVLRLSNDQNMIFMWCLLFAFAQTYMWNVWDVLRRWKKIPQDYFCQTFAPFFAVVSYLLSTRRLELIFSSRFRQTGNKNSNPFLLLQLSWPLQKFNIETVICHFSYFQFHKILSLSHFAVAAEPISLVSDISYENIDFNNTALCTLLTIQLVEFSLITHKLNLLIPFSSFHVSQKTRQSCDNFAFIAW